jgi:pimeloyl-ACP methyl ester carboxylesterase
MLHTIDAGVLRVAYLEDGPDQGSPVILVHGFPYDVHAYDEVAPRLVDAGCRVIIPYLRGYGPTRFRSATTPRSGQQAALAHDLLALMDVLALDDALLAGYDWGGRAACIVAALWPQRVRGLVSGGGYNIQNIPRSTEPQAPEHELRYWYQYYFHSERGRLGLARNREAFCHLLWRLWSPTWSFDERTYAQTAESFTNPDFVEVVIHSYRHRFGLVPGAPVYEATEQHLAKQPPITVPTVALDGADDGVAPAGGSAGHQRQFTGPYRHQVLPGAGHNLPQEAPDAFAAAVLSLLNAAEDDPRQQRQDLL